MRDELAESQKRRPYTVLKTGIGHLDRILNDVEGGELILVTGKPKTGKTTLLKTITKNMHKQGIETLWVPFEAGGAKFMRGFDEEVKFNIPRRLKPGSFQWLNERMREAIARYGVKAVFLDHLHRLANMVQLENPSIQLGAIVSSLITTIEELDVAMFMIVLMQKVPHTIPQRGDVRDSGVIEYECDTMLGIHRGGLEESLKSKLVVLHNRRAGTIDETIDLTLEGQYLVDDIWGELRESAPAIGGVR